MIKRNQQISRARATNPSTFSMANREIAQKTFRRQNRKQQFRLQLMEFQIHWLNCLILLFGKFPVKSVLANFGAGRCIRTYHSSILNNHLKIMERTEKWVVQCYGIYALAWATEWHSRRNENQNSHFKVFEILSLSFEWIFCVLCECVRVRFGICRYRVESFQFMRPVSVVRDARFYHLAITFFSILPKKKTNEHFRHIVKINEHFCEPLISLVLFGLITLRTSARAFAEQRPVGFRCIGQAERPIWKENMATVCYS